MRRSPNPVPAVLSFPEEAARRDCWGKLAELAPSGAKLSTRFVIERGALLFVSLRLGHEDFERIAASVTKVATDREGYRVADLAFTDEIQKRRLAKALLDILAT
ncbi:MAG: hypothetical protein HY927_17120 [Elusimicrobia bacterium]|nr:hypothetical protein [Elusimicrobiota bacterium]